jgi:16S rRNA (adenine1518-N6/adenine1519-N6)-dimethyltransferase
MPTAARHTKTYLLKLFQELGISPTTKLGQNFLVDPNLQHFIVDAAQIEPHDVVLEVGTGTGGLTALIADRAAAVVSVEVDRHLFELASEHLLARQNVTLLLQDALRNKNTIDQRVLDAVGRQLDATRGGATPFEDSGRATGVPPTQGAPPSSSLLPTCRTTSPRP